jgi:Ca-activated chloride channel family protein
MKFIQAILISFLFSLSATAQVEFDKVKHDFGDLEPYTPRYVDFILTNKGNKQEWLLSVKKPMEVVYINSKQFIEKDSSIIVRLQVNPRSKGKFNYTVEIFTSDRDEAVKVKLTGNLRETDQNDMIAFTSCPNFSERPGGKDPNSFDLTVVTIDEETKDVLSNSSVTLIQSGQAVWTETTDKKGKVKKDATLGLSYFYATHEGYIPSELGAYINFKRNYIVLELEKDPTVEEPPVPVIVDTTVIAVEPEPDPQPEVIITIEEQLEEDESSSIVAEVPPLFNDLEEDNFDEDHFAPINVVFVLDVSSSMKQVDKIELMKYSLYQLVDMLRPQDKIGLVTYASEARVLLRPTSGGNKDEIKDEVGKLKAFGYTSGGTGIKLGFKQAKRSYIDGGVNHVVVITDGAFNRNSKDYKKYVKKYAKKGISMSVVGIKNKSVDEEEMREAAELGKGHYIPIFKLSDAQKNLKHAVRLLTFKH